VDNQPGAGGILGTTALVKSAPDGNTLSVVSNNHVIYPSVYKSIPVRPGERHHADRRSWVHADGRRRKPRRCPRKPCRSSCALMKAKPDTINYGSSGNGTILHLAARCSSSRPA
jgi:tripartite-type tricarboxylate transporter receptor subunit TctC